MRHLTLFGKFLVEVSSQIEFLEGDFVIVATGVHLSEIDIFSFLFPEDNLKVGNSSPRSVAYLLSVHHLMVSV